MTAGYAVTMDGVNGRAGQLAMALRDDLYNCSQFCFKLQNQANLADAALIALGMTQADVTLLKNAFTDVGGTGISLYTVAHGGTLPGGPNDFFFNLKNLTGVL